MKTQVNIYVEGIATTVDLDINMEKVARILGNRAARSASNRATTLHGALKARVNKVSHALVRQKMVEQQAAREAEAKRWEAEYRQRKSQEAL
jgi:hypothetical protein